MKKVILITGKAQSGKSTAAGFLQNFINSYYPQYSVREYFFAEKLKNFLIDVIGLDYTQCYGTNEQKDQPTKILWESFSKDIRKDKTGFMSGRQVMQIFGTEICRKLNPNCWVESCMRDIINSSHQEIAIVSDVRFPNELEKLSILNPVIIRLTRNILDMQNESEIALDNFDFNQYNNFYLIDNTSLSIEEKNKQIKEVIIKYL